MNKLKPVLGEVLQFYVVQVIKRTRNKNPPRRIFPRGSNISFLTSFLFTLFVVSLHILNLAI